MNDEQKNDRRNFLKTAGASLVAAASLPLAAAAQKMPDESDEKAEISRSQPVYLSGCGWNRSLPGVYGLACFAFDVRAEVGGTGVGTMRDDVYQEVNSQFAVRSVTRRGSIYVFEGAITASRTADLIGKRVTITAEYKGNGTALCSIYIESDEANLVVIAIIACLMAMLMPAIQ